MDTNKLIARIKSILLTPKTEWPLIAAEPDTVAGLYKNYIVYAAAIPAIAYFLKFSIIGSGTFGYSYREGFGSGIEHLILSYLIGLGATYVGALIADALAPTFGGQKNPTQALKAVAYSWTASWIASIGILLGIPLGGLIAVAGLAYAIYLLYLGLQETMKSPADKVAGYTAATVISTLVVIAIASGIILRPLGFGSGFGGPDDTLRLGSTHGNVTIDTDGALGAFAAIGQKADEASKKMEAAKKSGDANAQAQAATAMIGAVLGGGDQVEALTPDALKAFLPDTLGGMPRISYEAQRNSPIGIQVSNAKATYRSPQGGPELRLEVTDSGGAKGIMALAGFANVEEDKQSDAGYEKTYHQDGRMIHEQWNKNGSSEYTIVLADRFVVEIQGSGVASVDALKQAIAGVNLSGLEALKNAGVKKD